MLKELRAGRRNKSEWGGHVGLGVWDVERGLIGSRKPCQMGGLAPKEEKGIGG